MALHLLERDRQRGLHLAEVLSEALDLIEHCEICSNLTEIQPCRICQDTARDQSLLCVVSSPSDILAIEQSGLFNGRYHCLAGLLSPLDGLGPEEIGLSKLVQRVSERTPLNAWLLWHQPLRGSNHPPDCIESQRADPRHSVGAGGSGWWRA